jgi:hypothetical protein
MVVVMRGMIMKTDLVMNVIEDLTTHHVTDHQMHVTQERDGLIALHETDRRAIVEGLIEDPGDRGTTIIRMERRLSALDGHLMTWEELAESGIGEVEIRRTTEREARGGRVMTEVPDAPDGLGAMALVNGLGNRAGEIGLRHAIDQVSASLRLHADPLSLKALPTRILI